MLCLPGLTPGGEARPGGRRLGRLGRPEPGERALLGERLEVRELSFVHPLPGESRVHAVEPHDEDALLRAAEGLAPLRALPAVDEGDGEGEGGEEGNRLGQAATEGRDHQGHLLRQRDANRVDTQVYPTGRDGR